nr:hypothetical protein [Tanacetum cinerariifolium]
DDENATNPPPVPPTPQAPHTISAIKLHILKKSEYDIWAMKMEHYLAHTDYPIWEVILKGNGLHKGYDRFPSLLSQLEIHGGGISTEDANQKFLKSLPCSWSQVSLIMRTKPGVDTLSFDDLYNNLRVFKFDVEGSTASSSNTQNVEFVSSDNTNSTNEVSTAYGVPTSFDHNSQKEGSSSYTDDLLYSFFANQSSGPQLDHEDLEQVDEFYLEDMDLKWQVAMISTRLKKFYKKTGRKLHFDANEPVGFDKTKLECFNCHNTGHFARKCRSNGNQESRRRVEGNTRYKARDNERRPAKQDKHKVMVTINGEAIQAQTLSESNSSKETLEYVSKPVESKPKAVSKPKVWSDAPIIEEYESDGDDEYVLKALVEQEEPSCGFINIVKHVKTPRQTVKDQDTCSQNPKVPKRDWAG